MRATTIPRFSPILRVIGSIIVLPSILGVAFAALMAIRIAPLGGAAAGAGLGLASVLGSAALVGGLIGWMLLMERNVYRCIRCSFIIDRADRAKAAKMPVVAIVVGGLGIGAAKTTDAIMKLPAAVTLAFTPYGSDPTKLAERARTQRHEILLQIPMEPFDYPDNDPGPQTLLTSLAAEQNLDRFYWHLSRFQGYAGIANFMGARFVVTDAVMQPIVREAAKRGLGYFDDGTAPRSVAPSLTAAQTVPFAKADLSIDAVPTAVEIDRALARLETLAKERGIAVGVASALPISIERISVWTRALESHGIMLVPLTTAMLKSKSG